MQGAPPPLTLVLRAVGPTVSDPHDRAGNACPYAGAAATVAVPTTQAIRMSCLTLPLRHHPQAAVTTRGFAARL
jgi:hypothetical protein